MGDGSINTSDWLNGNRSPENGSNDSAKFWDSCENDNDWGLVAGHSSLDGSTFEFESSPDGRRETFDLLEVTERGYVDDNGNNDMSFDINCPKVKDSITINKKSTDKPRAHSSKKYEKFYLEKFRPLACSTPKSKAGVLQLKEEWLLAEKKKRRLYQSTDLMNSFYESQKEKLASQNPIASSNVNNDNNEKNVPYKNLSTLSNLDVIESQEKSSNRKLFNLNANKSNSVISNTPNSEFSEKGTETNDNKNFVNSEDLKYDKIEDLNNKSLDVSTNSLLPISILSPDILINDHFPNHENEIIFKYRNKESEKELRRLELIGKIENICYQSLENLLDGGILQLSLSKTADYVDTQFERSRLQLREDANLDMKSKMKENNKFALIFFVLGEVYKLLRSRSFCNQRELYYKSLALHTSGTNRILETLLNVCHFLDCAPWELNVWSTVKGMVYGSLKMTTEEDEVLDSNNFIGTGMSIPNDLINIKSISFDAEFVLIVEKDTVYKRLVADEIFNRLPWKFLLITAKGQPDINTRLFLNRISKESKIPMFGLFDAGPFGIEIFLCYKYGSKALVRNSDELAIPSLKWIGVYPSEIKPFRLTTQPLSITDKKKIKSIMCRPYINDEIVHQLQILVQDDTKAEIEALYKWCNNYFIDVYLLDKIKTHLSTQGLTEVP